MNENELSTKFFEKFTEHFCRGLAIQSVKRSILEFAGAILSWIAFMVVMDGDICFDIVNISLSIIVFFMIVVGNWTVLVTTQYQERQYVILYKLKRTSFKNTICTIILNYFVILGIDSFWTNMETVYRHALTPKVSDSIFLLLLAFVIIKFSETLIAFLFMAYDYATNDIRKVLESASRNLNEKEAIPGQPCLITRIVDVEELLINMKLRRISRNKK